MFLSSHLRQVRKLLFSGGESGKKRHLCYTYVRDKEITRKMGACPSTILVSDPHFCPGRKLERENLQLFAKNGVFGEKLGILAGLSSSFDHFMAIFGTFCKFLHRPISLF